MAKDKKSIVEEFVEFISRGNVVDLAVGVIIGGAFTSVVNSLVSSIIQPLISAIGGNPEVKGLSVVLNGQTIDFGAFISAIISFLITAVAVFTIIKGMNTFNDLKEKAIEKAGLAKKAEEEAAPEPRKCPFCLQEIADDATRCPHCTSKLEGYENAAE
ncbi:large conductance mechanosensitive channel protein MscL [Collinsella tanakaei]|uniref:large conductance mechanosensitive channel protein MscL n=1 Tax=Collinsella tanakaei TaxID=626935 RepID=UPI00195C75DA|nr:large conductance mechanosensitive channel protein MscL [Collinsella tanakaei]MBM6779823.1 large conductance mechanosensitive channel protein MscL [Collinsella tanakaei]